jgi:hypothetical protein
MSRELPPVWLLDVDGVLNAVSSKPDGSVWPRNAWLEGVAEGWPIKAAEPVLRFVRDVHAAGVAEIRWHTTWQEAAQGELTQLLGFPDLPLQPCPEFHSGVNAAGGSSLGPGDWWKLPAAHRVLRDEGRRLLWTDDDLKTESYRFNGLGGLSLGEALDRSSLLVSPNMRTGLSYKNLVQIGEFLGCSDLVPVR